LKLCFPKDVAAGFFGQLLEADERSLSNRYTESDWLSKMVDRKSPTIEEAPLTNALRLRNVDGGLSGLSAEYAVGSPPCRSCKAARCGPEHSE
jgi:hypothetical protein